MTYIREIISGFAGLLNGMAITMRYAFKKPVTVIYPKERIPMKRFKGPISFVHDDKKNDHLCIACTACIKICPSRCMSLQTGKSAIDGKRVLTDFKVNYMLCSLCGLCIDVCPTDALKHDDPRYDMVSLTQKELIMDLMQPFRDKKTPLTQIPILAPGQQPQNAQAKPAVSTATATIEAPQSTDKKPESSS